MSMNLSDIAITNFKDCDYCCIISLISKHQAIKLFQNTDLSEKSETLQSGTFIFIYKNG